MARKTPTPAAPPPPPPLPAELLTSPGAFGLKLSQASTVAWQYWPAPVVAALLAGMAYALLMRPGLNLAAAEALAAGNADAFSPTVLTHVVNAFGTFFLTILTFLTMWGLGRLALKPARQARVPEVYSATFVLLIPLYLLVVILIFLTPASAFALNPAAVTAAQGQPLELQRAALSAAAHTPAALAFVLVTLLGTLGQFAYALPALKGTTGSARLPWRGVLLPLLPTLFIAGLGVAPLLVAR